VYFLFSLLPNAVPSFLGYPSTLKYVGNFPFEEEAAKAVPGSASTFVSQGAKTLTSTGQTVITG
jgi:hypothetical protein